MHSYKINYIFYKDNLMLPLPKMIIITMTPQTPRTLKRDCFVNGKIKQTRKGPQTQNYWHTLQNLAIKFQYKSGKRGEGVPGQSLFLENPTSSPH